MTRIAMTFRLSGVDQQQDLVREFALHEGVVALATESEGAPMLSVEVDDSAATVWDVRVTVGLFDDAAVELPGPASDIPA